MIQPIQPLVILTDEIVRFKSNYAVRALLDIGPSRGLGLNELALLGFPQEDEEQFAQLIGYSHSGFGSLSYASDRIYEAAKADLQKRLALEEVVSEAPHPRQPVILIDGLLKFQPNSLVVALSEKVPDFHLWPFSVEDREQYIQLLGWDLLQAESSGYFRPSTMKAVWAEANLIPLPSEPERRTLWELLGEES